MSRAIEVVSGRRRQLDFDCRPVERVPERRSRSGQAARGFDEHDPPGTEHRGVNHIDHLTFIILDRANRAPLAKGRGAHASKQVVQILRQIQPANQFAQLIDVGESLQRAHAVARFQNSQRLSELY